MACMYKNTDNPSHGKVLNADMLELMMECVPEACGRFGYGLGFMIEQYPGSELMLAGHRGANAGWQAILTGTLNSSMDQSSQLRPSRLALS